MREREAGPTTKRKTESPSYRAQHGRTPRISLSERLEFDRRRVKRPLSPAHDDRPRKLSRSLSRRVSLEHPSDLGALIAQTVEHFEDVDGRDHHIARSDRRFDDIGSRLVPQIGKVRRSVEDDRHLAAIAAG